jgi:hypothetical protein
MGDSPVDDFRGANDYSVDEHFWSYLMFKPDTGDARWVPLKYVDWQYGGHVIRNGTSAPTEVGESYEHINEPARTNVPPTYDQLWSAVRVLDPWSFRLSSGRLLADGTMPA